LTFELYRGYKTPFIHDEHIPKLGGAKVARNGENSSVQTNVRMS